MKIVVTMTSWPKRIKYVTNAICRFMETQTIKPDIFYLWLAEEEFPNKEKDLPKTLLSVCKVYNVIIRWTKENEYCFKRWYVYPEHFNDIVISIDDDEIYFCDTIEKVLKKYNECRDKRILTFYNCITTFKGINLCNYNVAGHNVNMKNMFFGNSIIFPGTFPLEIFQDEKIKLRKKYCPKCDESFIYPFLIKNGIFIESISDVDYILSRDYEAETVGLVNELLENIEIEHNHYSRKSILMYLVQRIFPELNEKWLKVFPEYEIKELSKFTNEEILEYI